MRTLVLTLGLFVLAFSPAIARAQPAPTIEQAHRAYYLGQHSRSLALYQQLATQGNAEAAERAGFMMLHGERTRTRPSERDAARALELLLQAAQAGRPGAGFILNMLEGSD
ncbi:MAG: hypothetical protein ABIS28_11255 [Caldimonas sp.]